MFNEPPLGKEDTKQSFMEGASPMFLTAGVGTTVEHRD